MIKAIEINNFGYFKDFNWKKDVGNYTTDITAKFSEINIIYGRNYYGKTTLSRIINCLDKKVVHPDYINSNFEIILEKLEDDEFEDFEIEDLAKMLKIFKKKGIYKRRKENIIRSKLKSEEKESSFEIKDRYENEIPLYKITANNYFEVIGNIYENEELLQKVRKIK